MAKFRYKRGERPLEGYTIEHGLGVGGFGEVYFAVSDAGREVALKALQNYQDIELRGIRNCMNLKSPHLVSVFDVRYNEEEEPFVIMEYVQGPSLRQLLDGSPEGIGEAKAAFFLREMAKGLTYLHEAGVVHRDLKPHNVFYEDGFVKIGDYSLCKMMSTSHRTGHTMTVGTVHYMAPEISEGRYDASVDIYALGIMLFEMLTGTPPYTGDSLGEVLMKHMTAEPKLDQLAEPYRTVVARALSKNPEDRYATPADMVEAIFGAEHVRNSVVEFNPQELTIVANMATKRAFTTPSGRPASSRPGGASWGKTWTPEQQDRGSSTGSADSESASPPPPLPQSEQPGEEGEPEFGRPSAWPPQPAPKPAVQPRPGIATSAKTVGLSPAHQKDPMPRVMRLAMAVISAAALAFFADRTSNAWSVGEVFPGIFTMIVCAVGLSMLSRLPLQYFSLDNPLLSRAAISTAVTLSIVIVGFGFEFWHDDDLPAMVLPAIGLALPFLFFSWETQLATSRVWRVNGWLLIRTALLSFVGIKVAIFSVGTDTWLHNVALLGAITTFGVGLCMQLVSPRFPTLATSTDRSNNTAGIRDDQFDEVARSEPAYTAVAASSAPPNAAPAPAPAPAPSTPRSRRSSQPTFDRNLDRAKVIGRIVAGALGIALFASSCILAILSMTMHRGPYMTLSIVGFGLTVASFGFLVGSGGWQGGAFGRMFAACMMVSWMHISAFSGDLPEPVVAMALPVAAALLAWPRSEKKTKD